MITHDRWRRIKEIFYSALDHPPADRSAFLYEVCGNDAEMLEEVEALLTADAENEHFLTEPAYELVAGMRADELREFSAGEKVGQYKIEGFISSGGMGQIYEAHDTKLGRKVALKFISPEYAKDPRRVQRFEQEARAASALNHPNLCVIHDVGVTENNRHFIAMEFIQGPTLRDELRRTFTPLEALDIIIQVGDALASAHANGIVHRDIKPENIMLRHDGYVKVVDFGLAKLTEALPSQHNLSEAETIVHTEPHMIMGTVRYMSPEQLTEVPVDERTDIWSLGVVLYEMLTGSAPFKARAPNESIALILSSQPQLDEDIPVQLRDILEKALEKDCAQRYQTVTLFTADLRRVKRELEMNAESDFPLFREFQPSPDSNHRQEKTRTSGSEIFTRLKSQAILTADTLLTEIRTPRGAVIFLSLTALIFLVPLGMSWMNKGTKREKLFQGTMKKLTQDGKAICAAISPDDQWVAYAEDHYGKQRLVVTNTINSGSSVAMAPADVHYIGIAFSNDSQYLYFTRTEEGLNVLYQLAWPGNNPVKLKEGVDSPISLSPQGDRFAFVRYDKANTAFLLVASNIDGTNEQVLAKRKDGLTLSLKGVAWSPDGNIIVCPVADRSKGWAMRLVAFDSKNGSEQPIGNQSWFLIQQVAWHPDLSGPIISASTGLTSPYQLFQIEFPDGDVHRITTDTTEYTTSVSLSNKNLVTISTDRQWRIWVAPLDNLQAMTEIVSGSSLNYGLSWSSNSNIFFSSMTQDGLNIFRINPDGSNRVQLTFDPGDNYLPASSPDGRFIAFVSDRSGAANIWRMNANDGGDATQLTYSDLNFYPAWSPDNQWVAYDNLGGWKSSVWKVATGGGEPIKVADNYRMPTFSPDSQLIACRYDSAAEARDVAIFPAQGGELLQHFEVPRQEWQTLRFVQNNHEISFVKNESGYSNLWIYDLKTKTSRQITNFKSEQIYAYAWSPDYKQIALLRGTKTNNVAIISNSER